MVDVNEATENAIEEAVEKEEQKVPNEIREELIKQISASQTAIKNVLQMAPDTVPYNLQEFSELDEEGIKTKLDSFLEAHNSREERIAFCDMLRGSMENIKKSAEMFEAELKLRTQPDDVPRVQRKFRGFKQRKGTW